MSSFCKEALDQYHPDKNAGVEKKRLIHRLHSKIWHRARQDALATSATDDAVKAKATSEAKKVVDEFKKLHK